MDVSALMDGMKELLNSGAGLALIWGSVMGLFMWLASRFNPFQEKWKAWEGSIITGIKLAEKEISDDNPHAGLAKLDAALKFVLNAYAQANNGKAAPAQLIEAIKQGIQITHSNLDRYGGLSSSKS